MELRSLAAKGRRALRVSLAYHFRLPLYDELVLNLTARCNSRCGYCEVDRLDHKNDLPMERLRELVGEAKGLGVRSFILGGGEPLLRPEFWEYIEYLHEAGMRIGMFTNGMLLPKATDDQLASLDRCVEWMQISLDSPDPATHDRLRGREGAWDLTTAGIRRAVERLPDVEIRSMTVVTRQSAPTLPGLVELGHSLGLKDMTFIPVNTETNYPGTDKCDKDDYVPSQDEIGQVCRSLDEADSLANTLNVATNLPSITPWAEAYYRSKHQADGLWFQQGLPRFTCAEPFRRIAITHDGGLLPCALLPACASVRDTSLREALGSLGPLKGQIRAGQFPDECQVCSCAAAGNYSLSCLLHPIANHRQLGRLLRERVL